MSNLLIKNDHGVNGKLVNEFKHLQLAKIGQKTAWSINLTSTQISTPFGYSVFSPSQTWFILEVSRFNFTVRRQLRSFNVLNTSIYSLIFSHIYCRLTRLLA